MKRTRRIVGSVLAAALLGVAGVATFVAPAQAAGCFGFSCHGHDPIVEGCPSASVTQSANSLAVVQNEFSTSCDSNWARGALTSQGLNNGDEIHVFINTTDSRGNSEHMCFPSTRNNSGQLAENCDNGFYRSTTFAFTDMVDGTNLTKAFVDVFDRNGAFITRIEADQ